MNADIAFGNSQRLVEGRFNLGIGYLESDSELFEALINQWNQHPLL